jgi:hypothetical protein
VFPHPALWWIPGVCTETPSSDGETILEPDAEKQHWTLRTTGRRSDRTSRRKEAVS